MAPPRCASTSHTSSSDLGDRTIDPGRVFDLALPLEQAAEGYAAMDQRTATKVLLTL